MTSQIDKVLENRFVRSLDQGEVQLVDFLSKRGYGTVFIAGFMGAISSMNISAENALKEISRNGFVDAPTQGMVRKYLEEGDGNIALFRRSTPAKMKEYIDLNSMTFDLYDSFQALKGMLDEMMSEQIIDPNDASKLTRTLKEIFETLNRAAEDGNIKTSVKNQYNIVNIVGGISELISPECSKEVDELIQKHLKLKHMKNEVIEIDGSVSQELG